MKSFVATLPAILLVSLLASASAQTHIGSVTLTRPATPAPAAAAHRTVPANADKGGDTMNTMAVPAGAQEIRGRIRAAGGTVILPAGSSVNVLVSDLTRPAQLLKVSFRTSRLSTPYQLVFNSGRLNRAHTYAVQANVTDASGKVLYSSDSSAVLPGTRRAVVDVTVR
ncbi:YbaY family lipoprotein [Deinococcus sp.]|uniref:YbaY family lipoprotein n=1 Tax=Deinococcus sp. TaxID=47478 RepID=UPI0025BC67ED|nr:YbaY family lipoprotein [Deinococcus sp.]